MELEDSSCDRAVDSTGIVFDPILLAPMFCVYHELGTTVGHKASFSMGTEITLGYLHVKTYPCKGIYSHTFNTHCHQILSLLSYDYFIKGL